MAEQVEVKAEDQSYYDNKIKLYIDLFCEQEKIDNLKKESQNIWNACLMFICYNVFRNSNWLRTDNKINYDYEYNMNNILLLLDYYIYLCNQYEKEISLIGFSLLTGIDYSVMINWGNGLGLASKEATKKGTVIYEKLNLMREESLSDKLATGKQNPVGILGILNRWYNWNMPGVRSDRAKPQALTAQELPQLEAAPSSTDTPSITDQTAGDQPLTAPQLSDNNDT